jgi:hypothetical protein
MRQSNLFSFELKGINLERLRALTDEQLALHSDIQTLVTSALGESGEPVILDEITEITRLKSFLYKKYLNEDISSYFSEEFLYYIKSVLDSTKNTISIFPEYTSIEEDDETEYVDDYSFFLKPKRESSLYRVLFNLNIEASKDFAIPNLIDDPNGSFLDVYKLKIFQSMNLENYFTNTGINLDTELRKAFLVFFLSSTKKFNSLLELSTSVRKLKEIEKQFKEDIFPDLMTLLSEKYRLRNENGSLETFVDSMLTDNPISSLVLKTREERIIDLSTRKFFRAVYSDSYSKKDRLKTLDLVEASNVENFVHIYGNSTEARLVYNKGSEDGLVLKYIIEDAAQKKIIKTFDYLVIQSCNIMEYFEQLEVPEEPEVGVTFVKIEYSFIKIKTGAMPIKDPNDPDYEYEAPYFALDKPAYDILEYNPMLHGSLTLFVNNPEEALLDRNLLEERLRITLHSVSNFIETHDFFEEYSIEVE